MERTQIAGITPNPESVAITLTQDGEYTEAVLWFGAVEGKWWARDIVTCADPQDARKCARRWKRTYKHAVVEDLL